MTDGAAAIVGMACVFPRAANLRRYWRNLAGGVDAITPLPEGRWAGARNADLPEGAEARIPLSRGGFIPTPHRFDARGHGVMPRVARDGDPDQFLLLDVVADALADADIASDDPVRGDTDLIVGRGGYASNLMMEIYLRADGIERVLDVLDDGAPGREREGLGKRLRDALAPVDVDSLVSSIPNLVPSRAANRLDLGGAAYTVDGACASSLLAVEDALMRLRSGRCRAAVAAGVNFAQIPAFWWLFTRILAVSPTERIRPFDRRADGMLIAEGAGAVVLKRLEDAVADGDRVWAVVRGAGSASDGRGRGVLAPSSRGQVRALERAYADAGVAPETITFLEAHGTGTPTGDEVEIETIRRFFGSPRAPHPWRVLGSVKSMIGHAMPAAGIASLIKVALALSNKILPPSLHCEEPHPALADTAFWVAGETRPWLHPPGEPRRAGVNAFGFGGIDAHVVLEEADAAGVVVRPIDTGVPRPSELLVFGAPDDATLARKIRQAAAALPSLGDEPDDGAPDLEDVAHALAGEADAGAPRRAALVAGRGDDVRARLGRLAQTVEEGDDPGRRDGTAFVVRTAPGDTGRLAAIFPGMGFPGLVGEFPRHLLQNALHFPAARRVFDLVERREPREGDPLPTSFVLVPPPHLDPAVRAGLVARFAPPKAWAGERPEGPSGRNLSHLGMLAGNHASWRILEGLGVRVDVLLGQSLGDLSAVLAAGMTDFEDNVSRLWAILDIEVAPEGGGIVAMVGASEEAIRPFLRAFPDVEIGLHFSPEALLVGGPEEAVRAFAARLREERVLVQPLPIPPVHTAQLLELEEIVQSKLGPSGGLRPARIPLWSSVLAAPMPEDPHEVEAVLRKNMARPIRFWQTLRRMADEGVRFLVQIGSGTLAANSRSVLERDDVVCEAMDVEHRHPLTQLQVLGARLFEKGIPFDARGLFAGRQPRPLVGEAPCAPDASVVPLSLYRPPFTPPRAPSPPSPERPSGAPAARAPALPLLGRVVDHVPGERLLALASLDLAEHRYLEDHAFSSTRGVKPLSHRFAVVPMTMALEMLAEHAAYLAPGLGLVAVEDLRAIRWLAFEETDRIDVEVAAHVVRREADRVVVHAEIRRGEERQTSADLVFAPRYACTLDLAFTADGDERPLAPTAADLYARGVLFHGPRFRVLAALGRRAGRGIEGTLAVRTHADLFASTDAPGLLLDPLVLDGVGQLVGCYFADEDGYMLPVAVERIELYRPSPPAGTALPVRIEFREIDREGRRTVADAEVQDGEGRVWFRIAGWTDRALWWTQATREAYARPEGSLFGRRVDLPGAAPGDVAVLVERRDFRDLPWAWLARTVLDADEWETWQSLPAAGDRRRVWLLGRVAAKDAVRAWQARRSGTASFTHPARLPIVSDGPPRVEVGGAPYLSIAHTGDVAIAVASATRVGIDIEPALAAASLDPAAFATAGERARLQAIASSEARGATGSDGATRLWAAKEAAGKALGRGLDGRPRSLEATEIHPDGHFVVQGARPGETLVVHTTLSGDRVIALAKRSAERERTPS